MSKEKKQSNTKNTSKKKNTNKVTDTQITKAKENKKKVTEEKSKVKVFDTPEEAYEEVSEEIDKEMLIEEDSNEFEEEEIEEEEEEIENTDDDDDDDDEDDDKEEEIIIKKVEKKNTYKNTSKEDKKEEKFKKIEHLAKEKKKKTNKNEKFNEFLLVLDKNRYPIYSFIGGVLLTTLIAMIIWPDRIATLKNGEQAVVTVGKETYTANELYENMKDFYSVGLLLDDIDNDLLTKLYKENDEMTNEVNSNAEYYLNMYQQYYGYTTEEFLKANGFSDYDAFLDYLKLDYRRNQYLKDYVKNNLEENEIENYYNENVFGDINVQHVLVEVSTNEDGLSDSDAKSLAEEIISKLNDGTSWEKIREEYKDKITYEDLGYQSWNASLESSFMNALKSMENNSYSEEAVKTSYGYHIIYRLDQKEAPKLKEVKDTIIDNLVAKKQAEDTNLLYKALISLREENKIEFSDTVMKEKYETYCEQYK